jgi:hypothetical protein
MTSELLSDIQKAVERASECKVEHVESLAVVEIFRGKKTWEGVVEAFKLIGHPKAERAYGWAYQDGEETRYVAVLEIPPVNSANTAVRAAIAAGAQK